MRLFPDLKSAAVALVSFLACATAAALLHAESPPTAATVKGSVHSIDVPRADNVAMPAGPGLEAYNANCVLCHTNRYVLMQPKFPRKTWEAEVTKMVNVYGAPIAEAQQREIVAYLMSIRGKETPPVATSPAPSAGGDAPTTK
ncbi:MAG: hypothetical protein JO295_05245 [Verrucomicrobia bacterium]|nr:hypothetical protein [Verrucomicrobiota bacterium]